MTVNSLDLLRYSKSLLLLSFFNFEVEYNYGSCIEASKMESTGETVKAKKARKPFVWTPARKAAFDKCKKMREQKLKEKGAQKNSAKIAKKEEGSKIKDLIKSKNKIREILKLLDNQGVSESEEEAEPVKEVKKAAKKVVLKPEPRKSKPAPPPPSEESEEEEEDYEGEYSEEEPEPPPYAPPKKIVNTKPPPFRYNTKTANTNIPKEAHPGQPISQKPQPQQVEKPQAKYLFL
jgi:hypothetical protein